MELNKSFPALFSSFLFMGLFASSSASTSISDGIFKSHAFTLRNLLQTPKACPVNFESSNYTIITSQCKGPQYPPKLCCGAFKEFACPYAELLNDKSNNCASIMFSYINLHGQYPLGLFANECQEGKEGLACPAASPSRVVADENGSSITSDPSLLLMLGAGFMVTLFQFL